jgi:hypothetical protein
MQASGQILNEGNEFSMAKFKNGSLGVSTVRVYMVMEALKNIMDRCKR